MQSEILLNKDIVSLSIVSRQALIMPRCRAVKIVAQQIAKRKHIFAT